MPNAALVASALTTHAVRPYALWVGGQDMILDPVSKRYGTPLDSIQVTEQGPGAVSSMSFRVEDPSLLVAVTPGMDVLFQWITNNAAIFRGWVQSVAVRPDMGQVGRSFEVECIGIECMLDWGIMRGDITFTTATTFNDAIQSTVANAIGLGPVRDFINNATNNGNLAAPVTPAGMAPFVADFTISAGTSVREALRTVVDACAPSYSGTALTDIMFTIDFYYGLRVFRTEGTGLLEKPDDYTDFTISNSQTDPVVTEGLEYQTDLGVAHSVFIKGLNIAGTGLITDGSQIPSPVAYIEDAPSHTAVKLQARGSAYLNEFASGLRGSFALGNLQSPLTTTHPGGIIILTDPKVGLSLTHLRIMSIAKTFGTVSESGVVGQAQSWTVSFGGTFPSMVNMVRRLTRNIRS